MTSSWGVRAKGQILVGWDWSLPLWLTGCQASAASTWAQYPRRTQCPWAWVCPCQSAWTRWTSCKYSQSERQNWLKIPLIIRSLGRIHQKNTLQIVFPFPQSEALWGTRKKLKNCTVVVGVPRSRVCSRLSLSSAHHRHQRNIFSACLFLLVGVSKKIGKLSD